MKCSCGRFDVRRISTGKKSFYTVPRETSGHYWPSGTHTFKMEYAPDSLCQRCHEQGPPTYTVFELQKIEGSRRRGIGAYAQSARALDNVNTTDIRI